MGQGSIKGRVAKGQVPLACATEKQAAAYISLCCYLLLGLRYFATEFPGCVGLRSRRGGGLHKGQV